jgi:hypothetical protein
LGATLAGSGLDRRIGPWGISRPDVARADTPEKRPQVGVVLTEFTPRSHAHVILENFLHPYLFNGRVTSSGCDVVSMYVDQFPDRDMARAVSREYDIPIYPTIGAALTRGGKQLAVDAVLSIGEHGNYPHNEKGQHEYPRKRFFDEIVRVFRGSDRVVPLFSDKHLSYRWDWAQEMYRTTQEMKIPFMAGSSVPLAQRRPPLELPRDASIQQAVSIHAGGVESYDFHALEVMSSMIEARRGGESGVSDVQFLSGDALWKAADDGLWSVALAEAAMAAELGTGLPPLAKLMKDPRVNPAAPHGILVTHRDGLRVMTLKVGNSSTRWNFACQLQGESDPRATSFHVGPWENRNLFKALSHAIQTHFRNGKAPYPVERTLLVTGILAASMESRHVGGKRQKTPSLNIAYQPRDYRAMREMGDSWKIITERTPEPPGVNPGTPPAMLPKG